jgi:hypothetical protein
VVTAVISVDFGLVFKVAKSWPPWSSFGGNLGIFGGSSGLVLRSCSCSVSSGRLRGIVAAVLPHAVGIVAQARPHHAAGTGNSELLAQHVRRLVEMAKVWLLVAGLRLQLVLCAAGLPACPNPRADALSDDMVLLFVLWFLVCCRLLQEDA